MSAPPRFDQPTDRPYAPGVSLASGVSGVRLTGRFFSHSAWPLLLVVLVPILALWNLGGSTVFDWDEAKTGQIAFEMVKSNSYFHYTSHGQAEQAFAKPPLAVWCIAVAYRIFGFTEFALRLPSALAALLVVFATYKTARLYEPRSVAVLACLVVVSSRGLFGWHVGRTGDTDALLVAGQAGFVFFFLRYLDGARRARDLIVAALCVGGAFWSKGIACAMLPAGAILYSLVTGRLGRMLRGLETWLAAGILAGFVVAWFALAPVLGPPFSITRDVLSRVVSDVEGHGTSWQPFFFLSAIESLWTPWAYLLGLTVIVLMMRRWRHPMQACRHLFAEGNRLVLVCACVTLPLLLVLVVMRSKLHWYAAPAVPYLAMVLVMFFERMSRRYRAAGLAFLVVLTVSFVYQLVRLSTSVRDEGCMAVRRAAPVLASADQVLVEPNVAPRHWLTLSWTQARLKEATDPATRLLAGNRTLLFGRASFVERYGASERLAAGDGFEIRRLP